MRLDVFPSFTSDDRNNIRRRDVVTTSQVNDARSEAIGFPHFLNLILRNFRSTVAAAYVVLCSFLVLHVVDVICGGSKKQMGGVHASSDITAMQNKEVGRELSKLQFIRHSMSNAIFAAAHQVSVAAGFDRASPQPAANRRSGLIYFCPEQANGFR